MFHSNHQTLTERIDRDSHRGLNINKWISHRNTTGVRSGTEPLIDMRLKCKHQGLRLSSGPPSSANFLTIWNVPPRAGGGLPSVKSQLDLTPFGKHAPSGVWTWLPLWMFLFLVIKWGGVRVGTRMKCPDSETKSSQDWQIAERGTRKSTKIRRGMPWEGSASQNPTRHT